MNEFLAIQLNTDMLKTLSCLPEKFVVDFANGIDVANDHLRVQKTRSGFMARLYDGFSGQGTRRQTEINASLLDSVTASLTWLQELSVSLARSNLAITQVKDRIAKLQNSLIDIANYSADTRIQLDNLSIALNNRCNDLQQELERIDLIQQANIHMDQIFSRWESRKLASLSLAGQCYGVLEELRWGFFGDLIRHGSSSERARHLEILSNRTIVLLSKEINSNPQSRIDIKNWLEQNNNSQTEYHEAISYLGDWVSEHEEPFIYSILNIPESLPLSVPRICSATRLTEAVIEEVFGENE